MNILKVETNYKRNLFFSKTKVNYKNYSNNLENKVINIYPEIKYQEIIGYAISSLSNENKNRVLDEYFSKNNLNYTFCRLPIGSSDFSLKSYSYSIKADLSDFSIEKDKKYIIPIVKQAQKINPNIKFLASPWSPPKFMKSNKMLVLGGKLLDKYKQAWANYLAKYILEYKKENINIDYITVQNEPNAIQVWESCLYSPQEEKDFVINYLYPIFKENHINTKILIWDHNKEKLYSRAKEELDNNKAFPGKLLIHTEGCTGYSKFAPSDEVHNAEIYAHDILGDLNSGINGYIDWNMVLDYKGGPNHKLNYCNSPIMVNQEKTNYIKNLSFYYISHFSHFIKPNSKRIAYSTYSTDIEVTAFQNTDGSISITLLNRNDFNKEYNIVLDNIVIHDNLDSHAIVSYLVTK